MSSMQGRVLHLLSQRPSLTGSGVTLDALVRHAAARGWEQWVVAGVPADHPRPEVGGLDDERILPLVFGREELAFPLPGMSDVMPYPSTRFSSMTADQLAAYRSAWRAHLRAAVERARPDLIHVHHVWLLAAMVKEVSPGLPVVNQCHATGLRQMVLCPHLSDEVKQGCARNERFVVLHQGHAEELSRALDLSPDRIDVVGAGYRDDLFHPRGRDEVACSRRLIYVGKYSAAKGLPWLLDAVERLPGIELHVAGSGSGPEAAELERRMQGMARVKLHGHLDQPALAELMRRCAVCVLPSFYEGVPLVLVEAMACGCRLVATQLPGVVDQLAPHLGDALELVPLPRLDGVDTPHRADLPAFVERLGEALERALIRPPLLGSQRAIDLARSLEPFAWGAVFRRVERVWLDVIG